jgi:hypothetical protein
MRREAIVKKSCKLDQYTAPGELTDFSAFSQAVRPDGTLEVETRSEWFARTTLIEEENWSRCCKTIMRLDRAE